MIAGAGDGTAGLGNRLNYDMYEIFAITQESPVTVKNYSLVNGYAPEAAANHRRGRAAA